MDNYIKKFNNFITSIRNHKDFECDGTDYTDMSRCIVEWLRRNPDPNIVKRALVVEDRNAKELTDILDSGQSYADYVYVGYIISKWNENKKASNN